MSEQINGGEETNPPHTEIQIIYVVTPSSKGRNINPHFLSMSYPC